MAKTGRFYHEIIVTTDASVTNAFNTANRHDINLFDCTPKVPGASSPAEFVGRLEGIICRVKTIAGGATKLTVKVAHTSAGTQIVIPDTEATIATEVGSTTEGGIAIKFDFPYGNVDDELHVFYKTDAGTCTVDAIEFLWSE